MKNYMTDNKLIALKEDVASCNIIDIVFQDIYNALYPLVVEVGRLRELENYLQMVRHKVNHEYGGLHVYIARDRKKYRACYVAARYNGANVAVLANELGVSERTIYRYLRLKTGVQ